MSRAPQGVYLNEAHHNRVTRLVENALDGHGSLSGFIDFVEQALLRASESVPEEQGGAASAASRSSAAATGDAQQEGEPSPEEKAYRKLRYGAWSGLSFRGESNTPFDPPSERLAYYERAWGEVLEFLPWEAEDPRSHVFALLLHSRSPRLWLHDHVPDDSGRPFPAISSALLNLKGAAFGPPTRKMVREFSEFGTILWRGNNLDVLLGEPKSKSTSFYLGSRAHELTLQLFGRDLFGRLERGLLRILDNPDHWLLREPQLRFLEHGTALLDYQQPNWDNLDVGQLELYEEVLDADEPPTDGLTVRQQVENDDAHYRYLFEGFSWDVRNEDRAWWSGPRRLAAFEDSLILAYLLGLVDLHENFDVEATNVKTRLLPAFLERYGLDRIGPERQLAYHVLKTPAIPTLPTYVDNAVEYHLLKLFQQYAFEVLPEGEREAERTHPAILATLSQPWVFPTKTTLESYGNANATKTATGDWLITKGKKVLLKMSDAEAYWTARTLNAITTAQPKQTSSVDHSAAEHFFLEEDEEQGEGPRTVNAEAWLRALEATHPDTQSITYKLGPQLLERARKQISKAGSFPSPTSPISAGVLLNAELTDEALGSNGRFYEAFRQNAFQDFSDFTLTAEQAEALRSIVQLVHGHSPAGFHRTRNKNGQHVWAYTAAGEEHSLANTFSASVWTCAWSYRDSLENEDLRRIFDWLTGARQDLSDEKVILEKIKTLGHEGGIGHGVYKVVDPNIDPAPAIEAARHYAAVYELAGNLL